MQFILGVWVGTFIGLVKVPFRAALAKTTEAQQDHPSKQGAQS
jgi:hypothetical protein